MTERLLPPFDASAPDLEQTVILQRNKTRTRNGHDYYKHTLVIPVAIVAALGWEGGDGIKLETLDDDHRYAPQLMVTNLMAERCARKPQREERA